jgi:hypothetical protein
MTPDIFETPIGVYRAICMCIKCSDNPKDVSNLGMTQNKAVKDNIFNNTLGSLNSNLQNGCELEA